MTNNELRELIASRVCEMVADMAFIFGDIRTTLFEPGVLTVEELDALIALFKSTAETKKRAREFVTLLIPKGESANTYDALCTARLRRFRDEPNPQP